MKTDTHLDQHETTREVIGAVYDAYNKLGFGFQEKYYQRAVAIELTKRGLLFVREQTRPIFYDDRIIGRYYADFMGLSPNGLLDQKLITFERKCLATTRPIRFDKSRSR